MTDWIDFDLADIEDGQSDTLGEIVADTPLLDMPVLAVAGLIWLLSTLAGPLIFVGVAQLAYSVAKGLVTAWR